MHYLEQTHLIPLTSCITKYAAHPCYMPLFTHLDAESLQYMRPDNASKDIEPVRKVFGGDDIHRQPNTPKFTNITGCRLNLPRWKEVKEWLPNLTSRDEG